MELDSCHIVSGAELTTFKKYRNVWLIGWMFAIGLAMVLAWAFGQIQGYKATMDRLAQLEAGVMIVQQEQQQINDTYVQNWEMQNKTATSIIACREFFEDKQDIIKYNKVNAPVARKDRAQLYKK